MILYTKMILKHPNINLLLEEKKGRE